MSRTIRRILPGMPSDHQIRTGGDARCRYYGVRSGKKMSPYQINPGKWKYPKGSRWNSPTPHSKLIAKNANRAAKKALRQHHKREIKILLNQTKFYGY